MASNMKLGLSARNAAVNAVSAILGAAGGVLRIYTGNPPPNLSDSPTGTFLIDFPFPIPIYDPAQNGSAALVDTMFNFVTTSGDAGWFRMFSPAAVAVAQGVCGNESDAPVDIQFDNKTLYATGSVSINFLTLTMPEQGS